MFVHPSICKCAHVQFLLKGQGHRDPTSVLRFLISQEKKNLEGMSSNVATDVCLDLRLIALKCSGLRSGLSSVRCIKSKICGMQQGS